MTLLQLPVNITFFQSLSFPTTLHFTEIQTEYRDKLLRSMIIKFPNP